MSEKKAYKVLDKLINEEQKLIEETLSHNSYNTDDLDNISLAENLNINEKAYKSALTNFYIKNGSMCKKKRLCYSL